MLRSRSLTRSSSSMYRFCTPTSGGHKLRGRSRKVILADLPADVLLCILALVDIYEIISLGQTCKALYNIAFRESKSIWLPFLVDLKRRGLVDEATTPDLAVLSAPELIDCVKRLAIGPSTWKPGSDGTFVPRVRTQRVVQLQATDRDFSQWAAARLLPGGRYVMASVDGRLAAWDIIQDRRVRWNFAGDANTIVLVWDVSRSENDEHTFVVAHSACGRHIPDMFHILEVNLASGTQTKHFSTEFELQNLSLQGDFCFLEDRGIAILLHWRSHTAVKLQYASRTSLFRLALVPGYAVILLLARDFPDRMFLLCETILRKHFAPIGDDIYQVDSLNVEGLLHNARLIHEFEENAFPFDIHPFRSNHTLTVCPSPLAPDEYRVWVSIRKRMHSLRLSVPRSRATEDGLQLHARSSTPLDSESGWQEVEGLTFSGHSSTTVRTIRGTQGFVICATDPDTVGRRVDLPQALGGPALIHVSPYGTWSCLFQRQVVVLYFE
ncbi:hypothetical protein MSAN_02105200 [Mycena sanguinolenta]|uniref:F-box domain-containing protein n=1 Tax=Mycena sanguinolenta TaxID=230812 RepID=A0A8H7CLS5_9AGAR|nr:hypothetical protein MSAN_02105200 [Mycena sanguinolenta]